MTKNDRQRIKFGVRLMILWFSFCLGLLVNRGPIFFPDTSAYIRVADAAANAVGLGTSEWSDRLAELKTAHSVLPGVFKPAPTPLAGRSVYYGSYLWLLGPWLAALIQAFVAAIAIMLLYEQTGRRCAFAALPITIAMSSATVFAALLMPDLLAALAIMAMAVVLTRWQHLQSSERAFWFCLLVAGGLAHDATFLIIVAGTAVAAMIWRRTLSYGPVLIGLLFVLSGSLIFSLGVKYETGQAPIRPPFLSARLIDDGPGLSYLQQNCPGFHLCDFYAFLPKGSDRMLWSQDGNGFISMSRERQRAWSDEDFRFVLSVIAEQPFQVAGAWIAAIGRQSLGHSVVDVTSPIDTGRLPADVRRIYYRTLVSKNTFPAFAWDFCHILVTVMGVALIASRHTPRVFKIIFLCILVDVLICGAFSTPHDRYLMRVIWLLPLSGVLVSRRKINPATATFPETCE